MHHSPFLACGLLFHCSLFVIPVAWQQSRGENRLWCSDALNRESRAPRSAAGPAKTLHIVYFLGAFLLALSVPGRTRLSPSRQLHPSVAKSVNHTDPTHHSILACVLPSIRAFIALLTSHRLPLQDIVITYLAAHRLSCPFLP
jgi:hypothetical protein